MSPRTDDARGGPLNRRPALARCVGPDTEAFARDCWGEGPWLRRAPAGSSGFTDLLSGAAVDELVATRGLRTPFLRMARDGAVLSPGRFTDSGGAGAQIADQASDAKILREMAAGATLVLQGLHRMWPPVRALADQLVLDLANPVQVNAYVTPASSRGFSPHYDTHDVFVLQVEGEKDWHLHRPVLDHPIPSQPWEGQRAAVAERAREAPYLDVTMRPGDALYIPRGWLHSATARGTTTMHLTIGVHNLTRLDLAQALATRFATSADLRRNLPLGADPADVAQLADEAKSAAAEAIEVAAGVPAEELLAIVDDTYRRATRPEPIAPLAHLREAAACSPHTRVRLRSGVSAHVRMRDDQVRIEADGRFLAMPARCRAALEQIATGDEVSADQLEGLESDEAVTLVARLLRDAIAVPVG